MKIRLYIIIGISLLLACSFIKPDGQYEVISELGHGGNGTVFLAKETNGSFRALKRVKCKEEYQESIPKEYLHFFFHPDETSIQAAHEFALSQLLHHESIITIEKIFTATDENGSVYTYLVMEYVDGKSLSEISPKTLTNRQAVDNVRRLISALRHAFCRQLMHEDLYSDNLMIDKEGKIKLVDIGSFEQLTADDKERRSITDLRVFDTKTHKQHMQEIIFAVLQILRCADFDEPELLQWESELLKIVRQDKFKYKLKQKISVDSCSYFISFLDKIDRHVVKRTKS